MKTVSLVAAIALIACKGKSDPAPASTKPDPPKPTPTAAPGKDWSVAAVTLTSGKRIIVNFRTTVPAGITPSDLGSRVTVRCPYPDRGDGTDFPTKEQLNQRQDLEERLESPSAIRLMSKTGDGARETVFQVKRSDELVAIVPRAAKEAGLECSTEVAADSDWTLWRGTIEELGKQAARLPTIDRGK
jgi:Family of unknown function (DUF695)